MNISNSRIEAKYTKLKTYFNCRLYRALHGRAAKFQKHSGWQKLIFRKTEDECTGENFSKWLEDTYALVKDFSGGDILIGFMYNNYIWEDVNYIDADVHLIINVLSIFITRMNPEEGKKFINFSGFSMYEYYCDLLVIKNFPNRLCEFKPEYLTVQNCLLIQQKFDQLYLFDYNFGSTVKKLYHYIDNMVQIRIALGVFGEKTGYTIIKEDTN